MGLCPPYIDIGGVSACFATADPQSFKTILLTNPTIATRRRKAPCERSSLVSEMGASRSGAEGIMGSAKPEIAETLFVRSNEPSFW